MVNESLARLSDGLLFAVVVVYALAMLGYAGEQASRRARRVVRTTAAAPAKVLVGAGGPPVPTSTVAPPTTVVAEKPSRAGRIAHGLTLLGWGLQLLSIVTRGFAAHRVPWGNMYEFSNVAAFVAVSGFLYLVVRGQITRELGAFVMTPVVLYLGLASTVLYTAAGPLVPALNSYWIKIHVLAAVTATGAFLLSGVLALLYLARRSYDVAIEDGRTPRLKVGSVLPDAATLDRVSYGVIAFAFPIWTFAIIAGAIWAESAWGRYWGWDPKETWSFITWVLYAGYLHARATAGWKGSKAAWVAVAAAGALIIDYYVVNIFVVGLHSYA